MNMHEHAWTNPSLNALFIIYVVNYYKKINITWMKIRLKVTDANFEMAL